MTTISNHDRPMPGRAGICSRIGSGLKSCLSGALNLFSKVMPITRSSDSLSGRVQEMQDAENQSVIIDRAPPPELWSVIQSHLPASLLSTMAALSRENKFLVATSVESQSRLMTQSAKNAAALIADPDEQARALSEIVKAEVLHNPKGAARTAESIADPFWKAMALLEVAKLDPSIDLVAVKDLIAFIPDDEVDQKRDVKLGILRVELIRDFEAIQEENLADGPVPAENLDVLAQGLIVIAEQDPAHDLEAARRIVGRVTDPDTKNKLLVEMVKVEALSDLEGAKRTAWSIGDPFLRGMALIEVAKADPAHDLAEVNAAGGLIEDLEERDQLCVEIVKVLSVHDWAEARGASGHIEDPTLRDKALIATIKFQAMEDLEGAKEAVDLIGDHDLQDEARAVIVEVEVMGDAVQDAKRAVESIAEPVFRVKALTAIITSINSP